MSDKPLAVIDTQVLLDWLVFADARVAHWVAAVEQDELTWIACPAIRREFDHMVGHPRFAHWQPRREHALSVFDRFARMQADPVAGEPRLRCRDADDQVFIDLALVHRARWLLTRDKALLALARRARPLGTEILRPWR
ncbi:MAG: putative toxin-antitoxin system toxin component, PIN family [Betaproteobacteria bacterium]|jgi:predicted nucleic acid-binding protein|nr:PIN domain-containing protein [Rubrivivax sp.]